MNTVLRRKRKEKGLSQEQLSKKSGVSRTIISGLESGRVTVTTTKTLTSIANTLDSSVEDIFFKNEV